MALDAGARKAANRMSTPIRDLTILLRSMRPRLHERAFAYCIVPPDRPWVHLDPIAMVLEREGRTLVIDEARALAAQLPIVLSVAWITLDVHSDLEAVGLTAAIAAALTGADISCNVVAGAHHDHLFVPFGSARAAMDALQRLQDAAMSAEVSIDGR